MFHLNLALPVILNSQLTELSQEIGISYDLLRQIAVHAVPIHGVITEDIGQYHKYDIIPLQYYKGSADEDRILFEDETAFEFPVLYGADGIVFLCKKYNIDFQPLNEISIPRSFYMECGTNEWYDISQRFFDVSLENDNVLELLSGNDYSRHDYIDAQYRLWEAVQSLETGGLHNDLIKWSHGRRIRSLYNFGYSLRGGWDEGILTDMIYYDGLEDEEMEAIEMMHLEERKNWWKENAYKIYYNYYINEGHSSEYAAKRADSIFGEDPEMRTCSIEGIGIRFPLFIYRKIFSDFLRAHKHTFIRSSLEEQLFNRIENGENPYDVFLDSGYCLDHSDLHESHWAVAIANIIMRENGIKLNIYFANNNEKYSNRNYIMFPKEYPWQYSNKEKMISRQGIINMFDRYAIELQLSTPRDCYYIIDVEDDPD